MGKVAVYTITRDRLQATKKSFKALRLKAGIPFDHFVVDNGSVDGTQEWLQKHDDRFARLYMSQQNLGQNIAANIMLDYIMDDDYEWVVRWDNDIIPHSRNFLKKLVEAAETVKDMGALWVMSPKILKLKFPPPVIATGEDIGQRYEVVRMLGGACRLHHRSFFDGWRFNKFGALGFGEANEVADRVTKLQSCTVRLPEIKVEHWLGEDGQIEAMPDEFGFEKRTVGRYIGFGLGE